ncbi:MAG: Bug family tripartite tricarboxylate transporter substrate binding protein, partial [Pseudomonadota bacterium]
LTGAPPGAPTDIISRLLAERLSPHFKQVVIVENKTGAGLNLAPAEMLKAKPDGHTLVVGVDTVATVNPLLYKKLDFDARKDMVPVSLLATINQVLVCNAGLKIASVRQLLDKAKQSKMTYASGGTGTPGHLVSEMFLQAVGADMVHVPYRGPSPAVADVIGGQVDCGWLAGPTALPHVKSGRLAALAGSSAKAPPSMPELPTLAQATGLAGLDATFKLYLFVPTRTPAPAIAALQTAVVESMQQPAIRARLAELDMVPMGTTSAQAAETLKADIARWDPVVRRLNLQLD